MQLLRLYFKVGRGSLSDPEVRALAERFGRSAKAVVLMLTQFAHLDGKYPGTVQIPPETRDFWETHRNLGASERLPNLPAFPPVRLPGSLSGWPGRPPKPRDRERGGQPDDTGRNDLAGPHPAAIGKTDGPVPEGSASPPPSILRGRSRGVSAEGRTIASLLERYEWSCQVCGLRKRDGTGNPYAEVHFFRPLMPPHDGEPSDSNAIVVCPDHHADLELGAMAVTPTTLLVVHAEPANPFHGRPIKLQPGHEPAAANLQYHLDCFFLRPPVRRGAFPRD